MDRLSSVPPEHRVSHPPTFEAKRNTFQTAVLMAWMQKHPEFSMDDQLLLARFIDERFGHVFGYLYERQRTRLPDTCAEDPAIVGQWSAITEQEWQRWQDEQ